MLFQDFFFCQKAQKYVFLHSGVPYLPVYNTRPFIIGTPILDCILKKTKLEQKAEKLFMQN